MKHLPKLLPAVFVTCVLSISPAVAVDTPYDPQLMRLAEVIGSVHYLRSLCGEEDGGWREQMEALIEAEQPTEERKEKLIASFNHGYRSFAAVYERCTEQAVEAISRYMKEGEELSGKILLQYSN